MEHQHIHRGVLQLVLVKMFLALTIMVAEAVGQPIMFIQVVQVLMVVTVVEVTVLTTMALVLLTLQPIQAVAVLELTTMFQQH